MCFSQLPNLTGCKSLSKVSSQAIVPENRGKWHVKSYIGKRAAEIIAINSSPQQLMKLDDDCKLCQYRGSAS
jgi:hypothetical protein